VRIRILAWGTIGMDRFTSLSPLESACGDDTQVKNQLRESRGSNASSGYGLACQGI
jgi:hypothetical protein